MTGNSKETSGITSEPSTASSDGSPKKSAMSLEGLLRGNLNGTGKTEVEDPSAPSGADDQSDLPGVQGDDRAAEAGIDWSRFDVDPETQAAIEEILGADPNAAKDQAGVQESSEGVGRSDEAGLRDGKGQADLRERPAGVGKDQRTVKMLAEDLDIEAGELYENLMVPLGDGTGRHISLEKLRAGYLGTDADLLAKERVEHEQRLAAFEVDKSEHQSRVVRERQEVSGILRALHKDLPPAVIAQARRIAQGQLATAAQDMLERFPAWRDTKVMQAWHSQVYECLKHNGFSRDEVAAITDARLCAHFDEHVKLRDWADKVRNPKPASKRPSKASRDKSRGSPGPRDRKAEVIARAKAPKARPEDKIAGIVALLAGNAPPE